MTRSRNKKRNSGAFRKRILISLVISVPLGGFVYLKRRYVGPLPVRLGIRLDAPNPLATWPWKQAIKDSLHPGVTYWLDRSASDGTMLAFFDFDFTTNPYLRLELYDQDEDDEVPFNNEVDYWRRGVGQVTYHLNTTGRGQVVAAWNGLFFATDDRAGGDEGVGRHVAPVVLRGRVY